MQIGVGGFHIEACTFAPLRSGADAFTVGRGDALLERYAHLASLRPDVTLVPLVHARALPGGVVERGFYEALKAEFLDLLRAGAPWDGVLLDMHGAAAVEGMDDAEGDWIAAVRAAVGSQPWLVASYDLHGNVSRRIFEHLDLLTAFRTAPHVDVEQTLERAFLLLVDGIRGGVRPMKAFHDVPVALPGEMTSTEWEPGQSLYAAIPELIDGRSVIDASMLVGYAWADEPRARASVMAYGHDAKAVQRAAERLAQSYWDARHKFTFGVPALLLDEAVYEAARLAREGKTPVFVSDSGDNPTAGGVGDVTATLEELLRQRVKGTVFASIVDAEAVANCFWKGAGATLHLEIGGKLDRANSEPLIVPDAEVMRLESVPYRGDPNRINRQAVVRVEGVLVILTEERTPFHTEADFQRLGIEPTQQQIVVVKIGYLEPDLKRMARSAVLALSPGVVNQDLALLPFKRIQRPIFPLDMNMRWKP